MVFVHQGDVVENVLLRHQHLGAPVAPHVAARDIAAGTVLCEQDLAVKRPGTGDSPYKYWAIQGKAASRSYKAGDLILE